MSSILIRKDCIDLSMNYAIYNKKMLSPCWGRSEGIPTKGTKSMQFRLSIPVTIFGDNQAAITLSKDPVSHSKSKHMDIKFHWQPEQVEKNEITYEYPQVKTSLISLQNHY